MFSRGAKIRDPCDEDNLDLPMVSFVDDNTIAHSAEPNESSEEIFQNVTREMLHWKKYYDSLEVTWQHISAQLL